MTLYIKTRAGDIYSSETACHFMVAEEYGVSFDDVIDTGFQTAIGPAWRGGKNENEMGS